MYDHKHTFKITYKYHYGVARLEAGGTPLRKSIEYCGKCNGASVYVKDESKNPFGTFKDRRCAAVLDKHKDMKELVLVHITSGNSGYSLGMMAKAREAETGQKIRVVNVVPKGLPKEIRKMLDKCSTVYQMDLGKKIITQEELRALAREKTDFGGPDEAIVGVEDYFLNDGYRKIVREMLFSDIKPTHIFCPIGEGELAVEITSAAQDIWGDEAPKVIGVTVKDNVFASGKDFMKSPGKSVADKLVNGYSKFRELWAGHVENGKAELMIIEEREIAEEYTHLNAIGISAEPSAAVAFCGAARYELNPDDVVVVINTGKGVYEHGAVDRLWRRRLRKAARYIAVAALSVALTVGGFLWKNYIERENRSLELQRQELMMQLEYETVNRLMSEVRGRLDRDTNGTIEEEEFADILEVLPDRSREDMPHNYGNYSNSVGDFTEEELRFYLRWKELQPYYGMIENDMRRNMVRAFMEKRRNSRARDASVMERFHRIHQYRNVRVEDGAGGTMCTFRDFDVNNPFDPSREERCD